MKNLAYVGVPCHLQALRKMEVYQKELKQGWLKGAGLLIGLFCRENWSYTCLRALVEDDYGVELEKIKKFDIKKKNIIAYQEGGKTTEIPLKESKPYVKIHCEVCLDFTAELADISVGAVGTPIGWSTIIARSKKGLDILDGAEKHGYIETRDIEDVKPGIGLIKRIGKEKIEENLKSAKEREELGIKVPHIATKEEMDLEKLKGNAKNKTFVDLEADVVNSGLCVSCGACEAVSKEGLLKVIDDIPVAIGGSRKEDCSEGYLACPRTFLPISAIEKEIGFNGLKYEEEGLGRYAKIVAVRAIKKDISERGQDGGAVTALLSYAIDKGIIDGAVAVKAEGDPWHPSAFIASSKKDLLRASGTIYSMATMIPTLKDANVR